MKNTIDFAKACAFFNIRKAARAVTSLYDSIIFPTTNIHATQLTVLMAVSQMEQPTISQLAEQLVMDRTTLARDLKPLEAQELLVVAPGEDRRTRIVRLTDKGRAMLETVIPLWQQAQQQMIDQGLGQQRWSRLYDELQEVVRIAQE